MAYTSQTWADSPATSSPLSAARLNTIEAGIQDASDRLGVFTAQAYPLPAYGLVGASLHVDSISSIATSVTINTIEIYRIYVEGGNLITGGCCIIGTAGITPGSTNDSGFALYSDDGATQIAKTVNDYTLFTSTGLRTKAFPSVVASQSAGRWVRLAMLHTCTTVPKFGTGPVLGSAILNSNATGASHRRGLFATSTLTFPASFTASTFGAVDSPMLFLGLF